MKKFLEITSVLLVLALSFSLLASCSKEPVEEETTKEITTTENTTVEETKNEQDTLVVSLGSQFDFVPFKYKDGEKLNGLNIDFMNAVANKLGMKIEFVETNSYSSVYEDKKVDVYLNRGTNDTFEGENVVFSKPYMTDTQSVIVKASDDYVVYDDFYSDFDADGYPVGVKDGVKIGVKKNTVGDAFASADFKDWGFNNANVKEFVTVDEMVNALKNGDVTAIIIDDAIARKVIDSTGGFKILESSFYSDDYSVAVVSEDDEKRTKIVNAINGLIDDGTVNGIVDKYMVY